MGLSPSRGGAGGGFSLSKIPLNLPLQKGDLTRSLFPPFAKGEHSKV